MAEREVALIHLQWVPGGYEAPPRTGAPMSRFVQIQVASDRRGGAGGVSQARVSRAPSSREVDLRVSPS